ncbi:PepSY domain-containing protein [Larkinella bovis]|uniref:PepSY domain-containing protein n=1 Tax=Larkinella bovis TaxID=683041 RepID=A0ABW0II35_9BACT
MAVSSFLLLALAALTGIILAFEPVLQKVQPYRTDGFTDLTLAQTLPVLKKSFSEISELSVDANQFVRVKGIDADGKNRTAFVDPQTGDILGTPTEQSEFFQWVTALHRSLFLHELGRFFIGLTAFLLLLITISGTLLIIQRQRGIKRFFTRIVRENVAQYYHVVLGRLSLIPIMLIALSGTYLSLARFGLVATEKISPQIDFDAIQSKPERKPADFAVFQNTRLCEVQTIEFPFSDDVEDYYTLKLTDRELAVNQVTGEILSENRYPTALLLTNLSLDLHTGRTSAVWAIILAVATGNILFFIYSGFAITWKRLANRVKKNVYSADESRFIILVGSENGSTFKYAQLIHQQLLSRGEKSYLTEFNNYTVFPKAEYLLAMTATYGLGDAPTNAKKFAALLDQYPQSQPIRYSVLGFGSRSYPDFCQFAFEVNHLLARHAWAKPLIDIHTVNDKSPADFQLWAETWSDQTHLPLTVSADQLNAPASELDTLVVTSHTQTTQPDGTFLIRFQTSQRQEVTSGDLLAIYPANDHRERQYSIGMVDNELQLSVRLHPGGLGSGYLHGLQPGESIKARLVRNDQFHFPDKAPVVVMIANGTGIAPFLGMISQNSQKVVCHLYGGFRERSSFERYRDFLEKSLSTQHLTRLQVAYSREGEKQYVSTLLARDTDFIANVLATNGVLMICGSLAMQKDVFDLLETICQTKLGKSVSIYQSHRQILTDCY